eukprot:1159976-Pelagomonas_calceolata.AAC.4
MPGLHHLSRLQQQQQQRQCAAWQQRAFPSITLRKCASILPTHSASPTTQRRLASNEAQTHTTPVQCAIRRKWGHTMSVLLAPCTHRFGNPVGISKSTMTQSCPLACLHRACRALQGLPERRDVFF